MKLKLDFVLRKIAGDLLLVPTGKTALDLNGMLMLNEAGAYLWQKLPESSDEAALVDAFMAEYEVTPAVAQQDVSEFLAQLRALGIVD